MINCRLCSKGNRLVILVPTTQILLPIGAIELSGKIVTSDENDDWPIAYLVLKHYCVLLLKKNVSVA